MAEAFYEVFRRRDPGEFRPQVLRIGCVLLLLPVLAVLIIAC